MNKTRFCLMAAAMLLGLAGCTNTADEADLTQFVNPFIGTAFTGHTYPGAATPFGMVQASPDTGIDGWKHCSGYHEDDNIIRGFSHTHLSGTGCPDMGDIMIMPFCGNVTFNAVEESGNGYSSHFSRDTEQASPGYYSVVLDDYSIQAEMTVTARAALHRYTYANPDSVGVVLDMEHGIGDRTDRSYLKVVDGQTVVGMRHSVGFVSDHQYYFCARFSVPFTECRSFEDNVVSEKPSVSGTVTKLMLRFDLKADTPLLVKVGLSTASEEGAVRNLDHEIPGWDFEKVRTQAKEVWNSHLKKIEVKTRDKGQKVSFYTSLYHALLMPNLITDTDGSYSGWDHRIHKSDGKDMFTNFSLWDTYRAEHPFLELLYPDINSLLVNSLLAKHNQTGLLATNEYGQCETWCMIGNHAVDVIADACMKGDKDIDPEKAYEAIRHAMTANHEKSDWDIYDQYGYFPCDKSSNESVSRTMEACYDDYCASILAKKLGRTEDCTFFAKRASNYKNLFDSQTGLVRPLNADGSWKEPFDSHRLASGDYTEGNAWQWTWHVQHDPEGLISQFADKEAFIQKLDSLFFVNIDELPGHIEVPDVTGLIGLYAQGNEPSHHIAYLYTLAGRPHKAAQIIRDVFDKYYLAKRDGLCGNDDCGQMSAWYMFSALGFYPVCPISGEYVFGAPQLNEAVLHLPNGKTFSIRVNDLSDENKYVKAIRLDGQPIDYTAIKYNDIMKGGVLEYDMTNETE